MKDFAMKERELLVLIEKDLYEIKDFLIGCMPEESQHEGIEEKCFCDTLKYNLANVTNIKLIVQQLHEVIIGGRH